MVTAFIALGSNLGKRQAALRAAVRRIGELPTTRVIAVGTFRQTAPVDAAPESPPFINSVVAVETELDAETLLHELLRLERQMGRLRVPGQKNGPRLIDLDLLIYGQQRIDAENDGDLQLPHPRMHLRKFVMEPLAEIAPEQVHPVLGKTFRELLEILKTTEAAALTPGGQ